MDVTLVLFPLTLQLPAVIYINFSLLHPYITLKTGIENTQTHQEEVVVLT